MLRIPSAKLLVVVALVWLLAGANILAVGISQAALWHDWWVFASAAAVWVLFAGVIFPPVVKRYSQRIENFATDRAPVWAAFDAKGYLIVVAMMSVGIGLRLSSLVPGWFIALFYLGLGLALIVAALAFLHNYGALMWRRTHPDAPHAHRHSPSAHSEQRSSE